MDPVGYSGTPLLKKLGIKPESRLVTINAPPELFAPTGPLPAGGAFPVADVILFFTKSQAEIGDRIAGLLPRIAPTGSLWVCWPKKASKVPTDIVEGELRTLLLPTGLVDNKVCAVSEVWSGLRFVVRVERRGNWPPVG